MSFHFYGAYVMIASLISSLTRYVLTNPNYFSPQHQSYCHHKDFDIIKTIFLSLWFQFQVRSDSEEEVFCVAAVGSLPMS